jgi:hypothetical protein
MPTYYAAAWPPPRLRGRAAAERSHRASERARRSVRTSSGSHGVSGLISPQSARKIVFDLLLRVAAILIAELHADSRGAFPLRAFRGHPDDAAGHRQFLFLTHQIEQHEHFIAQAIIAVGGDEQSAVFDERHISEVERALVLDRQRQQTGFVTWTAQFLSFQK